MTLAGDRPGIPSVDPGALFGYLPLSRLRRRRRSRSATRTSSTSTSRRSSTPAGPTTSIGVDSNGYVVVGGGTSEDNKCCDLPDGPDPARPNNILAPFWTDLDGTGAEGIYVAALPRTGVNTWLVVEWQVNVFGTTSNRHFQMWIGLTRRSAGPGHHLRLRSGGAARIPDGQRLPGRGRERAR